MQSGILRDLGSASCALAFVLVSSVSSGCGGDRYIVVGTVQAPSTSGFVELDSDDASGATFDVHMEQLHPVVELDPTRKAYVVWAEGAGRAPARLGVLSYNPDERTGELKHVRAAGRTFTVKITAEANGAVSTPSDFVVASQEIKLD